MYERSLSSIHLCEHLLGLCLNIEHFKSWIIHGCFLQWGWNPDNSPIGKPCLHPGLKCLQFPTSSPAGSWFKPQRVGHHFPLLPFITSELSSKISMWYHLPQLIQSPPQNPPPPSSHLPLNTYPQPKTTLRTCHSFAHICPLPPPILCLTTFAHCLTCPSHPPVAC